MSWLARLKNGKAPDSDATKPTKPPTGSVDTGYVGFVAPVFANLLGTPGAAANDPAPAHKAITLTVNIGTVRPPGLSPVLLAGSLALDATLAASATLPGNDPDADCWPHSTAMNGAEIDLFATRLHRFTDRGLTHTASEALADKLVIRDREPDDRRFCLECRHLSGFGAGSWRCGNLQAAGIVHQSRDARLPLDFVPQLQRCNGFANGVFRPLGHCDEPP